MKTMTQALRRASIDRGTQAGALVLLLALLACGTDYSEYEVDASRHDSGSLNYDAGNWDVQVDAGDNRQLHLIPAPRSVTLSEGQFVVEAGARLIAELEAQPIAENLARLLRRASGFELPVVAQTEQAGDIVFELDDSLEAMHAEAYELVVNEDRVRIRARTINGLFYATVSLRQLLPPAIEGESTSGLELILPNVVIEDEPRFEWRGFSFDVARHFFGVDEVKRLIDLASYHKLNRLHLHLTDDQGWRIEIKSWPNLALYGGSTEVGGGPGGYYTQAEYTELVNYAESRFVTLVPEIDLPGHSQAALASYPELNPSGEAPPLYTGVDVGFSSLWLGAEITERFVEDVLGEIAELTPGPYLHVGGDEATNTAPTEYRSFMQWVDQVVEQHGKTLIGWCDAGEAELSESGIVQHWYTGCAGTAKAADRGMNVVLSPADRAYLDMKYSDDFPFGHTWAGVIDVRKAYEYTPSLPEVRDDQILGVEAALWTEFVETREQIDQLVFPRLAGHAEIAWSPARPRSFSEYRERLAHHGARLAQLGVDFYRSPLVDWAP